MVVCRPAVMMRIASLNAMTIRQRAVNRKGEMVAVGATSSFATFLSFAKMPQAAAAEMLITKGDEAAARQPGDDGLLIDDA